MKKHVEKIRKWLGGAAEEHVVRMVAFWWLVYYQSTKDSDLLTVKAGGEDITLQLKHKKCLPFGYVPPSYTPLVIWSEPIRRAA